MKDTEILDEIDVENKLVLFSKFSIVLMSLLISPLFGGFLYCVNLRNSNQKEKIFSTFITIVICYLLVLLPLIGFEFPMDWSLNPFLYISNIVVALLMVFPFWKKHFEELEYESIIPWARIFALVVIYCASIFYNYWLDNNYDIYSPVFIYLPRFSTFTVFTYLPVVLFANFIFMLFKKKKEY